MNLDILNACKVNIYMNVIIQFVTFYSSQKDCWESKSFIYVFYFTLDSKKLKCQAKSNFSINKLQLRIEFQLEYKRTCNMAFI